MALNYIWISFFIISFIVALIKLILLGDFEVFPNLMNSAFSMAKTGFELSLGLTGVLTLWMGFMKVGEKGGMINILSKIVGPFLQKIFPGIPKNHPAFGSMLLNVTATMLGLDNAATPAGLKAMEQLQEINNDKTKASNAMIMFLVIVTSGLMLIPINIMIYRAQLGSKNPADIFIPVLLSTFTACFAGVLLVSIIQKINLFNFMVLSYILSFIAIIAIIVYFVINLPPEKVSKISSLAANFMLFTILILFILLALIKKVNIYDTFIEGAKEGFNVAVKIIPFLIAMLVAIGVLRASGVMDYLIQGLTYCFSLFNIDTEFVKALPTALMKPLSGSGARGMMIETMKTYGADSFAGRLSCVFQGATDTTFYIIALYFGSVGIKNTRYAILVGLFTDFVGMFAAVMFSYLFF
jgi:spore maturation protein SpmA